MFLRQSKMPQVATMNIIKTSLAHLLEWLFMQPAEFDKQLANWGRQSIAYAISLRAQDDGESLQNEAQVTHARNATEKIAAELWESAAKDSTLPGEFMMKFVRSVFDWIDDHRRGKPGKQV